MPDFTLVLLSKLAPAVGKALFKLWIGKDDLPNAVGGSGIDALATLLPNGQERAKATVRALADDLTRGIAAALGDAPGQSADDLEPVIAAVADTLDAAGLDLPGLLRISLDLEVLRASFRDCGASLRRELDSRQQTQFDRIIDFLARELPIRADQLPSFASHSTREILRRLDELASQVREVVARNEPSSEDQVFVGLYRPAAVSQLDRMVLFGLAVDREYQRYPLSVAYVRLSVSHDKVQPSDGTDGVVARSGKTVSAEELLGRASRLLIRGEPGSGKSTLLCWLAVQAAGRRFEGALEPWNDAIPFFLPLRKFVQLPASGETETAEIRLPSPEAFAAETAPLVAGSMPPGWVHRVLADGRALVLVDGIDEVPDGPMRESVREWIASLCKQFPKAAFVVSSRPYLPERWLAASRFDDFSVEPLSLEDAYQLIDRWHYAVAEQVDAEERARLPEVGSNLKAELRRNRPVRMLATNPLLCAMICALHRQKDEQLPRDRIELYQVFCDTLLDRRDRDRKVPAPFTGWLTLRYKQSLMQDLAWWMLESGYVRVTVDRAANCLERRLEKLPNRPVELTARRALQYLIERTGLLREPESGKVDFTHKTFMEFLAAQVAMRDDLVGVLVRHAADDLWQETIKLAAGLPGDKNSGQLIQELIQRGDSEPAHRHRLHLLAAACAQVSLSGATYQQELAGRMAELVPPHNMTEATALAAAGELAVPYLTASESMSAQVAACCVRALGLIGGEETLAVLEGYARDARAAVIEEMEGVLKATGPGEAGDNVLRNMPRSWRPRDASLRVRLARARRDATLDLSAYEQLTDLKPLAGLTGLTSLNLASCKQLTDLGPLAELTSLTSLNFSNCPQLTDLGPLAGLTSLTSLNLSNCPQLTDLGPLARFTGLTSLDFTGCRQLTDLGPLAGLTGLTSLDFTGCGQLADLAPLAGLTGLITLNLAYCVQLTDLAPLAELRGLTSLNLAHCRQLINLRPLAALPSLLRLRLDRPGF